MGQIYYFERPRTGDSQNTVVDEKDETGSMVWAGDSMWRYNDNWGLKGGIQYDRRLGSVLHVQRHFWNTVRMPSV